MAGENETPPKKWRVPGLPPDWDDYLLCLIFILVLPLLPLALEFWQTHTVSEKSTALAASMYAISVGTSTASRALLGISVVCCVGYAFAFGFLAGGSSTLWNSRTLGFVGMGLIFLIHALERYNRHVADSRPFLQV
jgi:hypothetical protein